MPCFNFTDGPLTDPSDQNKKTVELNETPGDHCYWKEIKCNGCKYYRNLITDRYLGEDKNLLNKSKVYENVFFIK